MATCAAICVFSFLVFEVPLIDLLVVRYRCNGTGHDDVDGRSDGSRKGAESPV